MKIVFRDIWEGKESVVSIRANSKPVRLLGIGDRPYGVKASIRVRENGEVVISFFNDQVKIQKDSA